MQKKQACQVLVRCFVDFKQTPPTRPSLGSSLIIFSSILVSVSWSILNEINNGQPIPLMWSIFILLLF